MLCKFLFVLLVWVGSDHTYVLGEIFTAEMLHTCQSAPPP